jgi:Xaa-Pro aminopeptidase
LRRAGLERRCPELNVDAIVITRLPNVRYLSGFTGSNGQVLLSPAESVFFTDGRYTEQSRHEVAEIERITYAEGFASSLAAQCTRLGVSRLGFEAHDVTVAMLAKLTAKLPGIELVAVEEEVEALRWVKDAEELTCLQAAQDATDAGFEAVLEFLAVGMTEQQVALDLGNMMRRAGADGLAFDSIVAFGENAAEPHHEPTHRVLEEGDVIKIDFGALAAGYHADMTRTVAFGAPPAELKKVHDIVREAQQAGIDAVKAGVTGGAVDAVSRSVIAEAGYGEQFTHSLGHGVGLEIHEGPSLVKDGDDVLPVGAVVTVEPGIYIPGLGGVRIEDSVEVTADGCRVLGSSTRELIEL